MPYSPFYPGGWKDWPDVSTPITSAALTHIEAGISAGGGSASPLTTRGDIWGFSTVDSRVPVGADGYALVADSTQALGIKWAAAPSGGTYDGWFYDIVNTWTYASATTFTISGNVTAIFTPGTRIKLTQTGVKYFAVLSSSFSSPNTTITISGGADYSLANAAITSPAYSYAENPQGYPGWFNYTSSPTGFSSVTTNLARFAIAGRTCTIYTSIQGTSNATTLTFTGPVTAQQTAIAICVAQDNSGGDGVARAFTTSGSATITANKDVAGNAFTASGTKRVHIGQFAYEF